MPTKKIGDIPGAIPGTGGYPCLNPEHNPPGHMVWQPGVYEHTCPGCGHKTTFTVPAITC